mgnify:CR=1 FL=1
MARTDGGRVDYNASPLLFHHRTENAAAVHDGCEVERDDAFHILKTLLRYVLNGNSAAGIVDEHIHPAVFLRNVFFEREPVGNASDVRREAVGKAVVANGGGDLFRISRHGDDRVARGGEAFRLGKSVSARSAGDYNDFTQYKSSKNRKKIY